MKQAIIFILLALPFFATGQNYLFEITPTNGQFRLLVTDDTREVYPRDNIVDFGLLDTATFVAVGINRIQDAKKTQANKMAQSFLSELSAQQTSEQMGAFVEINYDTWAAAQFANSYDGNYKYEVRGTGTNFNVYISGTQLRRTGNNNLLATITPHTTNWFTVAGVEMYQLGGFFVGRNATNQIVTLKRL